jgi:hypothetical protein
LFSGQYFKTVWLISIVARATIKMLRRKSKIQFVKQERNTQNVIALLNYRKRNATINAKNTSFHKKVFKHKERNRNFIKVEIS